MLALDLEDYPSRLGKNGQLGKFYIGNFEVKLRIIKLESSIEVGKFSMELQRIIEVGKLALKLEIYVVGKGSWKNEKLN